MSETWMIVAPSEKLEAALAQAEAAFARAVVKSVGIGTNHAATNFKLHKVRTDCRQLRPAPVVLDDSESITDVEAPVDIPVVKPVSTCLDAIVDLSVRKKHS